MNREMDRRDLLKAGVVSAMAAGPASDKGSALGQPHRFVLENAQAGWHVEEAPGGIRSVAFDNRITGRRFALRAEREFVLVFSASAKRLEIPWWDFRLGPDEGAVAPDRERGLHEGFHLTATSTAGWRKAQNLAGGQKGRVYHGYAWFRHLFELPEDARDREIVFVLGGYDQQSWNEHWIYVNGQEAGHRAVSGRWRTPGRYALSPGDPAYAALQFGAGRKNLLAVRAREYDFHFEGISEKALDRYVFRPYLFDQFISIGEPYLCASEFVLRDARQQGPQHVSFRLENAAQGIGVEAHYQLEGFLRRKWLEIKNESGREQLLLDIELDDFEAGASTSEGGHGEPVFVDGEAFCAVEHPAGINQGGNSRVKLWHCPGRTLAPGAALRSYAAVAAAAPRGEALDQFHQYLRERSPRLKKRSVSIFTTFGVNNQWGACPTLTDTEALDVQGVLKSWQRKGLKLDYFTLDMGWPDNGGSLTDFTPTCFPDGPDKIVEGLDALGMKFGLWFSVSWGGWSSGSNPALQPGAIPGPGGSGEPPNAPPIGIYRNGYPVGGGIGRQLCLASDPYFPLLRDAILHHVRHNKARLLKFDSGNYYCLSTAHGHLPGKYSTEAMYERLLEIARAAREIEPDIYVIWYWGIGSPFWALHGDAIFESGLYMEGSGTSWYPTLHYRDSVTLSLDQNTQFCKLVPAINKDSLGIWLSPIRWANFMSKERWREALVMDLGRGNLMFPQLWGDPYLLNEDDVRFLSEITALARKNEAVLLRPRRTFGDSWRNEPYGYAFFDGAHGFVFLNNAHFAARPVRVPLGAELGLAAKPGTTLRIISHFPERAEVPAENGSPFRAGETAEIWLRPFETLLFEVQPAAGGALPRRAFSAAKAPSYGASMPLRPTGVAPWMELRFADAARFEKAGMKPAVQRFAAVLPALAAGRSVLAIPVRLRQGEAEYRHSPVVAEVVQLRARIGGRDIQLVPVPDARQFGNTQSAGCSWVVYKTPLSARQSGSPVELAVHSYLPPGVTAIVEAWVVKQWWQENTRPQADGYYGDAPS
jgi:hypothetical protein